MIDPELIYLVIIRFVLFMAFVLVVLLFTKKVVLKFISKLGDVQQEKYLFSLLKFLFLGLLLYALKFSFYAVIPEHYLLKVLESLGIIFVGIAFLSLNNALVDLWVKLFRESKGFKKAIAPVIRKIMHGVVLFIVLMLVLQVWGVKISALLASLGVAGVAVALAIQATLGDFFSGVALVSDKAVRIGDVIEFGDITGIVEDISFRSIKVRTYDKELIIIPNSKLASSVIKINNRFAPRRIVINFGVEYGSDIEKVRKIALKVLKSTKEILKDPEPYVYFSGFGDSALEFSMRGWVSSYDDMFFTKEKVREKLYKEFAKEGISFAYPTQTIHLVNEVRGKVKKGNKIKDKVGVKKKK